MIIHNITTQEQLNELRTKCEPVCIINESKEEFIIEDFQYPVLVYGGHFVAKKQSIVLAYKNAVITARDKAEVQAFDRACIFAFDNSKITLADKATLLASNNANIISRTSSRVEVLGNAMLTVYRNPCVVAKGNAVVKAYGSNIRAMGHTKITGDFCCIDAGEDCTVIANHSEVYASGNALVEQQDSIVHLSGNARCINN